MTNVHINNFNKDAMKYVEQAISLNHHINVVTEKGNIVLLSEEEYRGLQDTVYLTSIPGMEEKLINAKSEKGVEIDWKKRLG